MKTSEKKLWEIEKLFMEYEKEIRGLESAGVLTKRTVNTYLTHAWNFVRWCRGTFEPGARSRREPG